MERGGRRRWLTITQIAVCPSHQRAVVTRFVNWPTATGNPKPSPYGVSDCAVPRRTAPPHTAVGRSSLTAGRMQEVRGRSASATLGSGLRSPSSLGEKTFICVTRSGGIQLSHWKHVAEPASRGLPVTGLVLDRFGVEAAGSTPAG